MSSVKSVNLIIACTGSVATIKLPIIINKLLTENITGATINIKVIVTASAQNFYKISDIPNTVEILRDEDEWKCWREEKSVLHIELRKWADLMVIAPLDANTLAKMAGGICDNLLLCTTRAWDMAKPLYFCPAMNTKMWEHPITNQHIQILKSWGHLEIDCISKTLFCGDTGLGAMADVNTIVRTIFEFIGTQ